jgi:transcription elongation factor GreA
MSGGESLVFADGTTAMEKIPMTAAGFKSLEAELEQLKNVERHEIIKAIAEARAHGDLSENAEYHAAKEKQSFIEGRVMELEDQIGRADVIDISKLSGTSVKFGATVTLVDEDTDEERKFQIVGDVESDAKKGKISLSSPIARALIGKSKGDTVEVAAPGGARSYEVLKVEFK